MITALAFILGAAWRRWWGDVAASWWPWKRANGTNIGYRGFQACAGLLILFGLLVSNGSPLLYASIKAGLAIGFLTAMAQSIPHVWAAWDWLDSKIALPKQWPFDGHTTYAEATAGAIVFGIAVAL